MIARLAPLALVALLAASCGDNDKKSATPATTAAATTTTATTTSTVSTGPSGTTPIPAQPSSKGNRLLLGKRDLYPLLAGNLSRYVPDQVRGKSVSIVQVAGIDSFWAGRNAKQRILVKLNLKGEQTAAARERASRRTSSATSCRLRRRTRAYSASRGRPDRPVLQNQGVYVLVSAGDLKLH